MIKDTANPLPLSNNRDELIDALAAADYIRSTPQTLAIWRSTGRYSLPYIKVGRLVRYRKDDLDAFLERRTVGGSSKEVS